jgi:hypothetical protein
MADVPDFDTVLQYLRRVYYNAGTGAWDIAAIKTLATAAFAAGTKQVTITATSSEAGGMASGQVTYDAKTTLAACEALLLEVDPAAVHPPSRGLIADFSQRQLAT